jgi:pilus assembly protein TadC
LREASHIAVFSINLPPSFLLEQHPEELKNSESVIYLFLFYFFPFLIFLGYFFILNQTVSVFRKTYIWASSK